MNFGKPLTFSLVIHALFIITAVWGASYFGAAYLSDLGGGGRGGALSVWIAETPEGADTQISKTSLNSQKATAVKKINTAEQTSDAEALNGGEGSGIGTGTGEGLGAGKDGDPLLKNIWRRINSSKYYPQIARRQGLEGTPRVTFLIGEDGSVKSVDIATSSGEAILDDAAKETVRRAAPLPYYPKPITLAVKYSLKD